MIVIIMWTWSTFPIFSDFWNLKVFFFFYLKMRDPGSWSEIVKIDFTNTHDYDPRKSWFLRHKKIGSNFVLFCVKECFLSKRIFRVAEIHFKRLLKLFQTALRESRIEAVWCFQRKLFNASNAMLSSTSLFPCFCNDPKIFHAKVSGRGKSRIDNAGSKRFFSNMKFTSEELGKYLRAMHAVVQMQRADQAEFFFLRSCFVVTEETQMKWKREVNKGTE